MELSIKFTTKELQIIIRALELASVHCPNDLLSEEMRAIEHKMAHIYHLQK